MFWYLWLYSVRLWTDLFSWKQLAGNLSALLFLRQLVAILLFLITKPFAEYCFTMFSSVIKRSFVWNKKDWNSVFQISPIKGLCAFNSHAVWAKIKNIRYVAFIIQLKGWQIKFESPVLSVFQIPISLYFTPAKGASSLRIMHSRVNIDLESRWF